MVISCPSERNEKYALPSTRAGVGNVQPAGCVRPVKSFGLILPGQLQVGLEIQ